MSQRLEGKYYTFERFKPHDYLSRLLLALDNYWTAMSPRKEHACVSGFIHRPWEIQCWCENKRYITLELAHKSMSITRRRKTKALYIFDNWHEDFWLVLPNQKGVRKWLKASWSRLMIVRNAGRLVFSYLVDRGLDRHTGWDMLFQVLMLSITKAYLISSLNIRLVFFTRGMRSLFLCEYSCSI